MTRAIAALLFAEALAMPAGAAQKAYDSGADDREIKVGNISAATGSAEAYGAVARVEAAFFTMINDRGGINGRKIDFISLTGDSGAAPLELARRLVDDDGVLLIFSPFGTETNLTIRSYLNEKKVPQLFVESSSAAFDDPAHFPWTMGFFATYRSEGAAYAKYVLQTKPGARIGVLYADDDAGTEYLAGVRDGLGSKASMIVAAASYRGSDTSLDSQIAVLENSGADVFFNFGIGAFATEAIRAAFDAGWHPLQFLPNASLSVAPFLDPAGLGKAQGIVSNARSKGWLRSQERSDPDVRDFLEFMKMYDAQASLRDQNNVAGYERAEALVEVLKRCGDDLTRANVMKQAAHLDVELGMLRPGISVHTSPTDYQPITEFFLIRFDGRNWVPVGAVISG